MLLNHRPILSLIFIFKVVMLSAIFFSEIRDAIQEQFNGRDLINYEIYQIMIIRIQEFE
jgi:hypothetical protein